VIFLVLSFGFEKAVRKAYQDKFLGKLPITDIILSKKSGKNREFNAFNLLNFFKQKPEGLSIKDYYRIKKITGSKIRGVILPLRTPVTLRAQLLGRAMRSDIVLAGVSRALIWQDIPKDFSFKIKENEYPIILPKYILNAYNTFADINSLPYLDAKNIQGLKVELAIGESSFKLISKNEDEIKKINGVIIGVSDIPFVSGLIIPLKGAQELNKKFHPDLEEIYSAIFLKAKQPQDVADLSQIFRKMGFQIESQADISQKANEAVRGVRYILNTLLAVILFFSSLAIINGFNTVVEKRKYEILIFRIFGASKLWLVCFLLLQVLILGLIYGQLGIYTAKWLMDAANLKLLSELKGIGFYIEKIFIPPDEYLHLILPGAGIFSILVTLIPAIRASSQPLNKSPEEYY
jgi:ABC-type antimicrobial peptide transport system permease subunit